jgi:hypothetical protein
MKRKGAANANRNVVHIDLVKKSYSRPDVNATETLSLFVIVNSQMPLRTTMRTALLFAEFVHSKIK